MLQAEKLRRQGDISLEDKKDLRNIVKGFSEKRFSEAMEPDNEMLLDDATATDGQSGAAGVPLPGMAELHHSPKNDKWLRQTNFRDIPDTQALEHQQPLSDKTSSKSAKVKSEVDVQFKQIKKQSENLPDLEIG